MRLKPTAVLSYMLLFFGITISSGEQAAAQATAAPTFFAPQRAFGSTESGVSVSRPGPGSFGIEGRYGVALNRSDLSFRAGYFDPGGTAEGRFAVGRP